MIIRKDKTAGITEINLQFQQSGLSFFFTDDEIQRYNNTGNNNSLAARFIAKQIIVEHFKMNDCFHEIDIFNDEFGKPFLKFSGEIANRVVTEKNLKSIHISLSHTRKYVTVFIIFEYF
jgi:phosphopantetheine--protein transferase-like protein